MKPFFPYYGSKYRLATRYPSPRGSVVVEPFAGSACYSLRHDVEQAILVDADPAVAATWRYLIGATPDEIMALPDLPHVGDSLNDHPELSAGAQALIGWWLNRGSATPKRSRTAFSARTDRAQLNWSPRAKERIAEQLPSVAGWQILEGDFTLAPQIEQATYFVDPPYQEAGRRYRTRFTEFDRLAEWCLGLPGRVVVCEAAGADWLPFEPLHLARGRDNYTQEVVWLS